MTDLRKIKGRTRVTHGFTRVGNRIPEYSVWRGMKDRCSKTTHRAYDRYGGRGIYVCDRWINSFENFISDMGRRPSPIHTIDRTDNDGIYEPGNCAWRTPKEQANNRSNNVIIHHNGESKRLVDWSLFFKVERGTLEAFLRKHSFQEAYDLYTKTDEEKKEHYRVIKGNSRRGTKNSKPTIYVDLTGKRFSNLTVIKFHKKDCNGNMWECLCDCGNTTYALTSPLNAGRVKFCGLNCKLKKQKCA